MKSKYKKVLSVGVFCAIVLVIFIFLNSLFQPIWHSWDSISSAEEFYAEPKNRIETVFVGSSIAVAGITPMELYDDYGICAYNLSTVNQPTMASYYWVEEAYRLHPETLKTVVFDVSSLRSGAGESYYHKAFDYMKLSEVKLRAIKEYADGDKEKFLAFMLPFAAYHNRWNELDAADVNYYTEDTLYSQRGFFFSDDFYKTSNMEKVLVLDSTLDKNAEPATDEFVKDGIEYFERMVEFCKEHDIELVLTKLPTRRWSSGLHHAVQDLADKNGLDFVDYNFSPLYDQVNFVFPFDCFDDHHLNYYGAHKITKLLGEYLAKNCEVTDVRGVEAYKYMEEQSEEYNARIRQQIALKSADTVEEYLHEAIGEDTTVLIAVKDSATHSLTEEMRKDFAQFNLNKLSDLGTQESYLAVIDKGEVKKEKTKARGKGKGKAISYKSTLGQNLPFRIKSGGYKNGNIAYIKIDGTDYAVNTRGLNIVVYNHVIGEVVDSTVFDTHAYRSRDTYSIDKAKEVEALPSNVDVDLRSVTGQVQLYLEREADFLKQEALRKNLAKDDMIGFLDAYMEDEDNLIIMACKGDVSKSLTKVERETLAAYGLSEYAEIEYGDSYVAMVEGNHVVTEISRNGDKDITLEDMGLYVQSAGAYSGSTCSILINGVEYAPKKKGINIVVYNQAENRVIDQINY